MSPAPHWIDTPPALEQVITQYVEDALACAEAQRELKYWQARLKRLQACVWVSGNVAVDSLIEHELNYAIAENNYLVVLVGKNLKIFPRDRQQQPTE